MGGAAETGRVEVEGAQAWLNREVVVLHTHTTMTKDMLVVKLVITVNQF